VLHPPLEGCLPQDVRSFHLARFLAENICLNTGGYVSAVLFSVRCLLIHGRRVVRWVVRVAGLFVTIIN
jgi:hypothetical protein